MPTLHIEHAITDIATWTDAFGAFAAARAGAGVTGERAWVPTDDAHHVVVALDFGTRAEAESFHRFLAEHVWPDPEASPGLAGRPQVRILDQVVPG